MANTPRPNPLLAPLAMGAQAAQTAKQQSLQEQQIKSQILTAGLSAIGEAGMRATLMPFNIEQARRMAGIQYREDEDADIARQSKRDEANLKSASAQFKTQVLSRVAERGGVANESDNKILSQILQFEDTSAKIDSKRYDREKEVAQRKTDALVATSEKTVATSELDTEEAKLNLSFLNDTDTYQIQRPGWVDGDSEDTRYLSIDGITSNTARKWREHSMRQGVMLDVEEKKAIISSIKNRDVEQRRETAERKKIEATRIEQMKANVNLTRGQVKQIEQQLETVSSQKDFLDETNRLFTEAFNEDGTLVNRDMLLEAATRLGRDNQLFKEPDAKSELDKLQQLLLGDDISKEDVAGITERINRAALATDRKHQGVMTRAAQMDNPGKFLKPFIDLLKKKPEDAMNYVLYDRMPDGLSQAKLMQEAYYNTLTFHSTPDEVTSKQIPHELVMHSTAKDRPRILDGLNKVKPRSIIDSETGQIDIPDSIDGLIFSELQNLKGAIRSGSSDDGWWDKMSLRSAHGHWNRADKGMAGAIASSAIVDNLKGKVKSTGDIGILSFKEYITEQRQADEDAGVSREDIDYANRGRIARKLLNDILSDEDLSSEKVLTQRTGYMLKHVSGSLLSVFNSIYKDRAATKKEIALSLEDAVKGGVITEEISGLITGSLGTHHGWHNQVDDITNRLVQIYTEAVGGPASRRNEGNRPHKSMKDNTEERVDEQDRERKRESNTIESVPNTNSSEGDLALTPGYDDSEAVKQLKKNIAKLKKSGSNPAMLKVWETQLALRLKNGR